MTNFWESGACDKKYISLVKQTFNMVLLPCQHRYCGTVHQLRQYPSYVHLHYSTFSITPQMISLLYPISQNRKIEGNYVLYSRCTSAVA